jgi:anti-sigma regulatory factor (Ser/Thr protein kinase)
VELVKPGDGLIGPDDELIGPDDELIGPDDAEMLLTVDTRGHADAIVVAATGEVAARLPAALELALRRAATGGVIVCDLTGVAPWTRPCMKNHDSPRIATPPQAQTTDASNYAIPCMTHVGAIDQGEGMDQPTAALNYSVSSEPAAASIVRSRLRRWLSGVEWPTGEADDLIYAVSEAVTNAAEHAYVHADADGAITIDAHHELVDHARRRVVVTVSDRGRWRPRPVDPGFRGRGITMMRAFTDALHIDAGPGGTRVHMISRAVPLRAGTPLDCNTN